MFRPTSTPKKTKHCQVISTPPSPKRSHQPWVAKDIYPVKAAKRNGILARELLLDTASSPHYNALVYLMKRRPSLPALFKRKSVI
jgi:hypothetical protein